MSFDPNSLAEWTGGRWRGDIPGEIGGFAFDARRLRKGEVFIALSGGARDGHDFVPQAAESGAVAAVVERELPMDLPQLVVGDTLAAMGAIGSACRRAFTKPVVGITGSSGKTSTKEMLHRILGPGRTHATAGNWNNLIGVPMTLFGLDPERQDFAVIEAGINQPGEMARLGAMIAPEITLVTHIGPAHLELLKSLEGVAREKSQLARAGKSGSPLVTPAAVLAYPAFAELADRAIVLAATDEPLPVEPRRVLRYRIEPADAHCSTLTLAGGGIDGRFTVRSRSRGICTNAGLAVAAACELGLPAETVAERLAGWEAAASRGQWVRAGGRRYYVDCYNANPASMRDALQAFADSLPASEPRLYVLGAMNELGPESARWHREIGRALRPRTGDLACFVGPAEWTRAYAEGAREAGWAASALREVEAAGKLKSLIAEFEGALFLKGSRSYALESLLPDAPASSH